MTGRFSKANCSPEITHKKHANVVKISLENLSHLQGAYQSEVYTAHVMLIVISKAIIVAIIRMLQFYLIAVSVALAAFDPKCSRELQFKK